MKLTLVEKLDLVEFADFKTKFFDWSKRQQIMQNILTAINSSDKYKGIIKDDSFFILPKTDYLVKINFDFDQDITKCVVDITNYADEKVKLTLDLSDNNRFLLNDAKTNINKDFMFTNDQLTKIFQSIDGLLPKVNEQKIVEANPKNFFKNIISKIGNKLSDTTDKHTLKNNVIKTLIDKIETGAPDSLEFKSYNIDLDKNTFSIVVNRKKGSNFILGFSLIANPDNKQQLMVKSLVDCRYPSDTVEFNLGDTVPDLQEVLDKFAEKLKLDKSKFRLSDNDQINTGSSIDQIDNRYREENDNELSPNSVNIHSSVAAALNDNLNKSNNTILNEDDSSDALTKATNLYLKKDDATKDIDLTIGDERAIIKYYLKKASGNDKITDQSLDIIRNIIKDKYPTTPFNNILIKFLISYLKKDVNNEIGSTLLKTLTEEDDNFKLLINFNSKGEENLLSRIILDNSFWNKFKQPLDAYRYLSYVTNYIYNNKIEKDKKGKLKLSNAAYKKLKDNYNIEGSDALNDLLKDNGSYRNEDLLKEILNSIQDDDLNAVETTTAKVSFIDTIKALKNKKKKNWSEIKTTLSKAFEVDVNEIENNKETYINWIKTMLKTLYNYSLQDDQIIMKK